MPVSRKGGYTMEHKQRLFAYMEDHRQGLVSTLRELVKIDTQIPPGLNYDKRDENVSIDELVACAKAVALFTLRILTD